MTNKAFLVDANGQVLKQTGKTLDSSTGADSLAALTAAQVAAKATGTIAAGASPTYANVLPDGSQRAPMAEGAYFGKKLRRGKYGRAICRWDGTLTTAGTASTVSNPSWLTAWADSTVKALRLQYDVGSSGATVSSGQQTGVDGLSGNYHFPLNGTTGSNYGIWAYNPGARALNAKLSLVDAGGTATQFWTFCVEPGTKFITLPSSASQRGKTGSFADGTHNVAIMKVEQVNTSKEGAWQAGDELQFATLYADVTTRPRFLITFDDGFKSQKYPTASQLQSGSTGYVKSGVAATDVFTTNAAHGLSDGYPIVFLHSSVAGGMTRGTTYWVGNSTSTTFKLYTAEADALAGSGASLYDITADFTGTGTATSGGWHCIVTERSGQQVVENYGFRGTLFIVGSWIGTSGQWGYATENAFLSASDIASFIADGWSIGSHSNTHPSNLENAGLRLLGPYGYFLSNPADNLPAQYLSNWALTNTRRRATSATQASPSVVTFEAAHQFIVNQPIVWTDVAPTGFTLGVTYYVATTPSTTTATFSTDPGTHANLVNNAGGGAWSGTANYRHPGSALDDSAIYADVVAGCQALAAIGVPNPYKFFALPQGGADEYVRSALIRAGITWTRGTGGVGASEVHTIPLGVSSGSAGGLAYPNGGWIAQLDSVQTDSTNSIANMKTYVDNTVSMSACGCLHHHTFTASNTPALDRLCSYLRTKVDAGSVTVQTADEMARDLGF